MNQRHQTRLQGPIRTRFHTDPNGGMEAPAVEIGGTVESKVNLAVRLPEAVLAIEPAQKKPVFRPRQRKERRQKSEKDPAVLVVPVEALKV